MSASRPVPTRAAFGGLKTLRVVTEVAFACGAEREYFRVVRLDSRAVITGVLSLVRGINVGVKSDTMNYAVKGYRF